MNRSDLQRFSNARIREAKILFGAREYSGSYYLAGYSVECALKACFARGVKRYDFPDKRKVLIHNLTELVELANLRKELSAARQANLKLSSGWDVVCKWTEESRYSMWTRENAEALLDAIARRRDGVLPWIKQRW